MNAIYSALEDSQSDIIKKAREGLGLPVRDISDKLGVKPSLIVSIENGEVQCTKELAELLSLSFDKLKIIYNGQYMPNPISEKLGDNLILKRFKVSPAGWDSNAYILFEDKTKSALLVDSIGESDKAFLCVKEEGLFPKALFITHGHFDHISGIDKVKNKFSKIKVFNAGKDLDKDLNFDIDGFCIKVFKTPGHSEDSVCFLVNDKVMFTGDTIFAGSVGRPNYSYKDLIKNIKDKIFTLKDNVILAPGHGSMTTVLEEKKYNPFFK